MEVGKASLLIVRKAIENLRKSEEQLEGVERFFRPKYFVSEYESLKKIIDSLEDKLQETELTK